jgi:hypothetical protein
MNPFRELAIKRRRVSKAEVADINPYRRRPVGSQGTGECTLCGERYLIKDLKYSIALRGTSPSCLNCALSWSDLYDPLSNLVYYYEMKIRRLERKLDVRNGLLQKVTTAIKYSEDSEGD